MGTIGPPKPVAQERSAVTELETMLLNWLPTLAPSRNNHGGKCGVAESINSFRRGMFFVQSLDPYDGKFPDFTYGVAGGTHRRPVHLGSRFSSEAQGPADGKRRLIRGEGLVARISDATEPNSQLLGRTFQDRRPRVMWGPPGRKKQ